MVPPLIKISGSATVCQHFYDTKGISKNSYYKNRKQKKITVIFNISLLLITNKKKKKQSNLYLNIYHN